MKSNSKHLKTVVELVSSIISAIISIIWYALLIPIMLIITISGKVMDIFYKINKNIGK